MKKLLVLILVLGLCSTANAVLTDIEIYIDGSAVGSTYNLGLSSAISVEIQSNNTDYGLAYIGFETSTLYTLANPAVTDNAGDFGSYYGPFTYPTYFPGETVYQLTVSEDVQPSPKPITAGVMFMVDLTSGSTEGTITVTLYDDSVVQYDTVDIIIPEPMTIALLGLGGLFLRRRR